MEIMERLRDVKIQEYLCRMMSSKFDDVSDSELHPLLAVLKVIKDEYSYLKPEVYRTLIAILNDYDPSLGQEHRDKTVRYISILLDGRPELANQLLRSLPQVVSASDPILHRATMASNITGQCITRATTSGHNSTLAYAATGGANSLHVNNISESQVKPTGKVNLIVDHPTNSKLVPAKPEVPVLLAGLVPPRVTVQLAGATQATAFVASTASQQTVTATGSVPPRGECVLLVRPSIVRLVSCDTFRLSRPRFVFDNKQRILVPSSATGYVYGRPMMLGPKESAFRQPPLTRPQLTSVGPSINVRIPYRMPRLMVQTQMCYLNKTEVLQNKKVPVVPATSCTDRESPLSCIEQLVANAGSDMSKTISDVEFGVDEVSPLSIELASCGALLDLRYNSSDLQSRLHQSRSDTVGASKPMGSDDRIPIIRPGINCSCLLQNDGNEVYQSSDHQDKCQKYFASKHLIKKTEEHREATIPTCSEHRKRHSNMESSSSEEDDSDKTGWCKALNLKRRTLN